jgi:hypothetical protein
VIRHFRRTVVGLVAAGTIVAGLTACATPAYTYAADSKDQAYFKVPASWPQVSPQKVSSLEQALTRSLAGATGGRFSWARAYAAAANPPVTALLSGSTTPVVYASVQDLRSSLRATLSFDQMRDLLLPVTLAARQQAAAQGLRLSGFDLVASFTITTKDGVRGINELFEYTVNRQHDAFDQTVLTNSDTTKLYLLLVQCYQQCFVAHEAQIRSIVNSFTVRGT